jgi:hypothetical protein
MQLPVLLQAPTGCVGFLLNRWQDGHNRSARCGVEKNLLPLPGIKPWTRHYYNTARYQHQNEWRNTHEETLGRREQGWCNDYRKLKVPCDTPVLVYQLHSRQNIDDLLCVCGRSPRGCYHSSPSNDCAYRTYSELILRHTRISMERSVK